MQSYSTLPLFLLIVLRAYYAYYGDRYKEDILLALKRSRKEENEQNSKLCRNSSALFLWPRTSPCKDGGDMPE